MIFSYLQNMQSHPSWVCGLKLLSAREKVTKIGSHPSWVCGLKQEILSDVVHAILSHPSWVCGLKHISVGRTLKLARVTPFVGVWIETNIIGR